MTSHPRRRSWAVLTMLVAAGCASADATPDPAPVRPPPMQTLTNESDSAGGSDVSPPRSASSPVSPPLSAPPADRPDDASDDTGPAPLGCPAAVVADMTPQQRAGQVLMVGVDVTSTRPAAEVVAAITDHHAGSVFLVGSLSGGGAGDLIAAVADLAGPDATAGVDLHVAVDQEGGEIQVLRGPEFSDLPAALDQGVWTSAQLREAAQLWGRELADAGVTMNLAPVADVVPLTAPGGPVNQPIGRYGRQFGSTSAAVTAASGAFAAGMTAAGITPVLKHFPGLGRASGNTDFTADVVDTVTTREDDYLAPFRAGIDAGIPVVMTATATYTQIDPTRQAAFSPVVTDLLRDDLGFDGVIVSDDVGKAASVANLPVGQRATGVIAAGGDLVITFYPEQAGEMTEALVTTAEADPRFDARLREAATRVVTQKASVGLVPGC